MLLINTGPKLYHRYYGCIIMAQLPWKTKMAAFRAKVSNFAIESVKWPVNRTKRRHRPTLSTINGVDMAKSSEGSKLLYGTMEFETREAPAANSVA